MTRRQASGYLNAIKDIHELFHGGSEGGGSGDSGSRREELTDEELIAEGKLLTGMAPKYIQK